MNPQTVTIMQDYVTERRQSGLTRLMRRIGSAGFARVFVKAAPVGDDDPYLLVLLADQELGQGREEQARYLVEAAYESFDRKTKSSVYQLRPAR